MGRHSRGRHKTRRPRSHGHSSAPAAPSLFANGHETANGHEIPQGDILEGEAASALLARARQQIEVLLVGGAVRQAFDLALQAATNLPPAAADDLVLSALNARLDRLGPSLAFEAQSLLELVGTRRPSLGAVLDDLRRRLAVRFGKLYELLAELRQPAPPPGLEAAIADALRRELTDPAALASCEALPLEHPWRQAAAVIVKALQAVTNRRQDDGQLGQLELHAIPRRSPLAAFSVLVRAIAAFYRGDDALCRRLLAAIDPDSAPARLRPALAALCTGDGSTGDGSTGDGSELTPAARALLRAVGCDWDGLRRSFAGVDGALAAQRPRQALQEIRKAVRLAQQKLPADAYERLRQRISVRCYLARMEVDNALLNAVGGPTRRDATFHRLLALAAEQARDEAHACVMWSAFRHDAEVEGLLDPSGPQAAALDEHLLDLLLKLAPEQRRTLEDRTEHGTLDPAALFMRLCEREHDPRLYERWLVWAQMQAGPELAKVAAERWHEAHPQASRPLLHLARAAQQREALSKALRYVDQLERVDGLNPEVRELRVQLTVAAALRHLRASQDSLARKDIATLDALPVVRGTEQRALTLALRCLLVSPSALTGRDQGVLAASYEALLAEVGHETGARLVLRALSKTCQRRLLERFEPADLTPGETDEPVRLALLRGVARAASVLHTFGIPLELARGWEVKLVGLLLPKKPAAPAEPATTPARRRGKAKSPAPQLPPERALVPAPEPVPQPGQPPGEQSALRAAGTLFGESRAKGESERGQRPLWLLDDPRAPSGGAAAAVAPTPMSRPLDPAELRPLIEAALAASCPKLAYAATGHILQQATRSDGPVARVLLQRAQSLPEGAVERRRDCLAAAALLARRDRDLALVSEVVDAQQHLDGSSGASPKADALSDSRVSAILARERQERGYPRATRGRRVDATRCDCPACRARRLGIEVDDDPDLPPWDDDDDWDEEDLPLPDDVGELSLRAMARLRELAAELGRMPGPEDMLRLDPALFRELLLVFGSPYLEQGRPARGQSEKKRRRRGRR